MKTNAHPDAPMPYVDATLRKERLPTHRIRPLYRGTQVVWYLLGIIELFLALRFLLKLFGANPAAVFTQVIDAISWVFVAPFFYVFRVTRIEGAVFEWSTLLAMAVYWLFAWLIVRAMVMSRPISTEEADWRLPDQE